MHPSPARRLRLRRGDGSRDEGFALITTVMTLALLAAFSLVALHQTLESTALSRKDQDWVAALTAAQAGIDDYVARLNDSNGSYHTFNTTPSSPANPDGSNPAMGLAADGSLKWAPLLTAGGEPARGSFHYDVDTTKYASTGHITVSSTGRVGKRSRTLKAQIRRAGFVDYVYFTDMETIAPLLHGTQAQRDTAVAQCSAYYGTRAATCLNPAFAEDVLDGPVHSNDTMLVCNAAEFRDKVTTASPPIDASGAVVASGTTYYRTNDCPSGTGGTTFKYAGDPAPRERINMPATNMGLKAETSAAATPRGCLYAGPTKIVIDKTQIRVRSPWTRTPTPGCPANDTWFTIPASGVVYVDVVPAEGTTDPNSWPPGTSVPGKPTCPAGGASGNHVGYPITGETHWHYPCKAGDVFIEQLNGDLGNALDGRLTVAAHNNLYVTNHLDYAGGTTGSSFLGLIAEQFLYVWHPTNNGVNLQLNPSNAASTPFVDPRISAAMLSVNNAVTVQNWSFGAGLGTLTVKGAIVQRFRGPVKQGSAGYNKAYSYDPRLHYDAPPKFLQPATSSFGPVRTTETKPQYS